MIAQVHNTNNDDLDLLAERALHCSAITGSSLPEKKFTSLKLTDELLYVLLVHFLQMELSRHFLHRPPDTGFRNWLAGQDVHRVVMVTSAIGVIEKVTIAISISLRGCHIHASLLLGARHAGGLINLQK
jgi:hypothetical protein